MRIEILRNGRKLGNRVLGVKRLQFGRDDKLGTTRLVRTEEIELAVMECAAESIRYLLTEIAG